MLKLSKELFKTCLERDRKTRSGLVKFIFSSRLHFACCSISADKCYSLPDLTTSVIKIFSSYHDSSNISGSSNDDEKALKEIIEELGGWPLLEGSAWDDSKWSIDKAITKIRKLLAHRSDKIFDIASFIISLENANNVSCFPSPSTSSSFVSNGSNKLI